MYRSIFSLSLLSAVCMAAATDAGSKAAVVTIDDALAKLDTKRDADWLADGAPSLERVRILMRNSDVTQEDLDKVAGDLRRPSAHSAPSAAKALAKASAKREAASEDQIKQMVDPDTGRFNIIDANGKRLKVFVKNAKVAAAERGFASGAIRDPGDVFMYTGELGTWMMPGDHDSVQKIKEDYERTRREALNPAPIPVTG